MYIRGKPLRTNNNTQTRIYSTQVAAPANPHHQKNSQQKYIITTQSRKPSRAAT